jgi:hypothetical protein
MITIGLHQHRADAVTTHTVHGFLGLGTGRQTDQIAAHDVGDGGRLAAAGQHFLLRRLHAPQLPLAPLGLKL